MYFYFQKSMEAFIKLFMVSMDAGVCGQNCGQG